MKILQRNLTLLLVAASVSAYLMALISGVRTEWAVLGSSVATIAAVWWLERRIPFREDWSRNRGDLGTDIASAGVLVGVVDPLVKALAPALVVWVYGAVAVPSATSSLPPWAQALSVLLIVEFGKYWSHRAHHALAPLWWLHAMHHGSERLYFLNGLRFHPLNHVLNFAASVLPAMLLGFSAEAIWAYLAFTQPIVLMQHSNIDLRQGWVNGALSTPEAHRWHHSTSPDEANRNYGSALLLWDHVFGTYKAAGGFAAGKQVGLFSASESAYPRRSGYVAQLLSMCRPPCCCA